MIKKKKKKLFVNNKTSHWIFNLYYIINFERMQYSAPDRIFTATGSCLSVPEYEAKEILEKSVLQALACSTSIESPFLVVLILPAWED